MILYFTGTGNSRFIAENIAGETGEELVCINEKIKAGETDDITVSGNLILVTPTYAWRIPKLVREWILQRKFIDVQRVWFVMNCGDSIGSAEKYNRKLCLEKGWTYMGTMQITMPENYIAMFPVRDRKGSFSGWPFKRVCQSDILSSVCKGRFLLGKGNLYRLR